MFLLLIIKQPKILHLKTVFLIVHYSNRTSNYQREPEFVSSGSSAAPAEGWLQVSRGLGPVRGYWSQPQASL